MTKAEYKTESVMKKLDEQYSKYKFMEANLTKKKERYYCIFKCALFSENKSSSRAIFYWIVYNI